MMNKEERNKKIKSIAKKGLTISLCAVLTAGVFGSVSNVMNWNEGIEVNAADDEAKLTMTKKSKKTDDSEKEDKTETAAKGSLDVSDIAEEAMPSVVSITTKSIQEVQNYFGMFGGYGGYTYAPEIQEVEGSGSGIIIGKNSS